MVRAFRIGVDDASHGITIGTVDAGVTRRGIDVGHAVFAIEADVAFQAVDAIDTVFTGDADAIFAVGTLNRDAVVAVDSNDVSIAAVNTDRSVRTIFRTDSEVVGKFQVIRGLTVYLGSFQLQIVSCIVSRSGCCAVFNGYHRVFFSNVLNSFQLTAVNSICRGRTYITGCNVSNLIAAVIEAGTRQGYRVTRRRRNGNAVVIDNRSTCLDRAGVAQVDVFIELNR